MPPSSFHLVVSECYCDRWQLPHVSSEIQSRQGLNEEIYMKSENQTLKIQGKKIYKMKEAVQMGT